MSEQRLSTAQKVLSGGMMLLFAQGMVMLITFLAQREILSTLTKDANGLLFAQRRFVELFVIFAVDFGMNSIIMRRVVQEPDRAQTILSSAAATRLGLWIAATLVAVIGTAVSGLSVDDAIIWSCYLLIASRTGLMRYVFEIPQRSQMRFAVPTLTMILDAVLFLGLIWMQRDSLTPSSIIATYALASLPGFVIIIAADRGRTLRPKWVSRSEIRTILVQSLPVFIAFGLMNVHDKIDAVMLDWFSTPREVGIFGAAYVTLAPLTGTVPLAAVMVLVPVVARYAQTDFDTCRQFALTGLRFLVATAIVLSSVLSSITPLLIDLISKGRYADNVLQYFVFLWLPVPLFLLVYIQEMMIALGHQRQNVRITATLAIATVLFGAVLIPGFDSMGAVVTKVLAVVASTAVALWIFRSILQEGIDLYFVLSVTAVTGVCIAAAWFVPQMMPLSAAAFVVGGLSVAALATTRLIRSSDVSMVFRVIRSRKAT